MLDVFQGWITAQGAGSIELQQRLKPGGRLLLFVTRRNLVTRLLAEKWWKTTVYDESEIRSMLRRSGFDTVLSPKLSPGWSASIMAIESRKP
jgi:hypothetical protein